MGGRARSVFQLAFKVTDIGKGDWVRALISYEDHNASVSVGNCYYVEAVVSVPQCAKPCWICGKRPGFILQLTGAAEYVMPVSGWCPDHFRPMRKPRAIEIIQAAWDRIGL